MLSYRHAFHAGNHADVLKHYVLSLVLAYMKQKDKPYWYIDTHAGAGLYQLKDGYASQNAEFEQGIAKLMAAEQLAPALVDFVALIKSFNHGELDFYPGSPLLAQALLRADDKMRLFELHPSDHALLTANFQGQVKQVQVAQQDGFAGIKACLPPPPRRAVALIDPPYEDKQDYQRVVNLVKDSLKRFASGTYLIWYPILQRPEPGQMIEDLMDLQAPNWLHVSLSIHAPNTDGYGMHGSGLFILNPPWTLAKNLEATLPSLCQLLALDDSAQFTLEHEMA